MKSISLVIVVLISMTTGCQNYQPLEDGVMLSPDIVETLNRPLDPSLTAPGVCRDGAVFELRTLHTTIAAETGPRGRIGNITTVCRITSFACANGLFEIVNTEEDLLSAC